MDITLELQELFVGRTPDMDRFYAEYKAARAPLIEAYQAKSDMLYAEYRARLDPVTDEYRLECNTLYDALRVKCHAVSDEQTARETNCAEAASDYAGSYRAK